MNKYPMWKYAIIAIALVVSLIYGAPNMFGEVPAIQVYGARATVKVDAALKSTLEDALKGANLPPADSEMDENAIRFKFDNGDAQLKAREVIQSKVGPNHVVALTLMPASPHVMQAMNAKPMSLGLDH